MVEPVASTFPEKAPTTSISDGDIVELLSAGRRILPSQQLKSVAPTEIPYAAEVERSGVEFCETVASVRSVYAKIRASSPAQQIDGVLNYTRSFAEGLQKLITAIHGLPPDSPNRPRAVGEVLLPFAISLWTEYPPSDDGSLILEFYRRQQQASGSGAADSGGPLWIKDLLPFINIAQTGVNLPVAEDFIAASKATSPRLKAIREEISGLERKITNVTKTRQEAKNDDEYSAATTQLTEAEANLARAKQRISPLLEQATDVKLSDVPAVFNALNIRIAPKDEVWKALCQAVHSLEGTIYLATYAGLEKRIESSASLTIPWPTPEGKIRTQKLTINAQELKALGKDPQRMALAVSALKVLRDTLYTIHEAITGTLDLSTGQASKIKSSLQEPISHLKAGAKKALCTLIKHPSPVLSLAAMQLLETPAFESIDSISASPVLELPRSFDLLTSVVNQFLHADHLRAGSLQEFFNSQPQYQPVLGVLEHARKQLQSGNIGALARFLDEQLLLLDRVSDKFSSLVLLAILEGLTEDPLVARELRYQIPNLSACKGISKFLIAQDSEFETTLPDSVHNIVCTFSQSLRDYYSADKDGRLQEAVDMYRFYLRNRERLKGIPANHALKNSIATFGPPGVGKTFFAHCLENELDDVTLEVLSPGEKAEGQDRLSYTKSIIEKVKSRDTPTLLLIDEAETTAFDRMSPLATSEDRACTNYLLQVVDDLRKNYPRVFILIASNYPERVDEAMVRPGRVDLIFYLNAPGPKEREDIFRSTLKKENINLLLSEEQMNELVALSERFIPIQIIQAITETERLYIPFMRSRGKEMVWSFELLKSRIELMALDDRHRKEKRTVMSGGHRVEEAKS